eukprot:scaffold204866_cov23-Tisochrysis_lutea.AAC.1
MHTQSPRACAQSQSTHTVPEHAHTESHSTRTVPEHAHTESQSTRTAHGSGAHRAPKHAHSLSTHTCCCSCCCCWRRCCAPGVSAHMLRRTVALGERTRTAKPGKLRRARAAYPDIGEHGLDALVTCLPPFLPFRFPFFLAAAGSVGLPEASCPAC